MENIYFEFNYDIAYQLLPFAVVILFLSILYHLFRWMKNSVREVDYYEGYTMSHCKKCGYDSTDYLNEECPVCIEQSIMEAQKNWHELSQI